MVARRAAMAFEHDDLRVVEEPAPGGAPQVARAAYSDRSSECTVMSKQNFPHAARDQDSTIKKSQSVR